MAIRNNATFSGIVSTDLLSVEKSWAMTLNPGHFPMSELFELPIQGASAEQASKALWEMYKRGYMDEEFAQFKVIFLFTTSPYQYQWAQQSVSSLADFKGRRIRSPDGIWAEVVKALGAVPLSTPVGEIYGMMENGMLDGVNFPWNGLSSFRLEEVTKHATATNMLYFPLGVMMKKEVWQSLPSDVQAIIDEVGEKYSIMAGREHDEWDRRVLEDLRRVGVVPTSLPPTEMDKLKRLLAPFWDKWIAENEAKGLPAKKAVDDLYSIFRSIGVEEPFVR